MHNPYNRCAPLSSDISYIEPIDEFLDVDAASGSLRVASGIDQTVSSRDLNIYKQIKLGGNLQLMTSYFSSDKTIDIDKFPGPDEFKEEKLD